MRPASGRGEGIARIKYSVRRLVRAGALALVFATSPVWRAEAAGRDVGARPPGRFDYYVLSLSWVPGFCATHRRHVEECASGLGFALHGLWPQLNGGDYPTACGGTTLTPSETLRYQGLYAAPSLIEHEWPKHGTCSGLSPETYFALSARDVRRVRIPAAFGPNALLTATNARAVKSAFMTANPGLPSDGITTVTDRGALTGVEICVTKTGSFRAC